MRWLVILLALMVAGCATKMGKDGKTESTVDIKYLAKSEVDRIADTNRAEVIEGLLLIADKLYKRNPKEWKKAGLASREQARELLPLFGLAGFEDAWPAQLSGGMRQRAALLRTVLAGHDTLLLDEPFGALDALTRLGLQDWLAAMRERFGWTLLTVTHSPEEAVYLADRVLVLSPRPARPAARIDIDLPRPRVPALRADPAFGKQVGRVLTALGLT